MRDAREPGPAPEIVYYDGHCALCHGVVRFLLRRDPEGDLFRYAPLQGETFAERVAAARDEEFPDSVCVETRDGRLLVRSTAVAHLLRRLGGAWRALGAALIAIPRPLRDLGYDAVARVRFRVFGRVDEACPLVPEGQRGFFLP